MGNKGSAVLRVLGQSNLEVVKRAVKGNMEWPFTGYLPRPLRVGDRVEVEGTIAEDAEIFTINLVCEHDLSSKPHNVAYHHKMMFSEGKTILNSKHDGTWQEEEHNEDLFFAPGESFKILLLIMQNSIITYCNDVHHSQFDHRLPIEDVRYLQIWHGLGKIDSMKVSFA